MHMFRSRIMHWDQWEAMNATIMRRLFQNREEKEDVLKSELVDCFIKNTPSYFSSQLLAPHHIGNQRTLVHSS